MLQINTQPYLHQTSCQLPDDTLEISINYDDTILAITDLKIIHLYQILDCQFIHFDILQGHQGGVTTLQFSSQSNTLFSGARDKLIIVWKSTNIKFTIFQILKENTDWIQQIALFSNDSIFISTCDDHTIKVWKNSEQWSCVQTIYDEEWDPTFISFNKQQNLVTCVTKHNSFIIWNFQQDTLKKMQAIIFGLEYSIQQLFFSEENLIFALTMMHTIEIWKQNDTNLLFERISILSCEQELYFIHFNSHCKYLTGLLAGSAVKIYHLNQNHELEVIQTIEGNYQASITSNIKGDNLIIIKNYNIIELWCIKN